MTLKRWSDALLLLAIAFVVIGVVGPAWAYAVAAVLFVASVAVTSAKRRRAKARKGA